MLVAILAAPVLGALVRLRRRHTVVIEDADLAGRVSHMAPVVTARNPNRAVAAIPASRYVISASGWTRLRQELRGRDRDDGGGAVEVVDRLGGSVAADHAG